MPAKPCTGCGPRSGVLRKTDTFKRYKQSCGSISAIETSNQSTFQKFLSSFWAKADASVASAFDPFEDSGDADSQPPQLLSIPPRAFKSASHCPGARNDPTLSRVSPTPLSTSASTDSNAFHLSSGSSDDDSMIVLRPMPQLLNRRPELDHLASWDQGPLQVATRLAWPSHLDTVRYARSHRKRTEYRCYCPGNLAACHAARTWLLRPLRPSLHTAFERRGRPTDLAPVQLDNT